MPTVRKRAKHTKTFTEDPIYNNTNYKFDWTIVGKNLYRRRMELGMTQQDVSDCTGIPAKMISQYENNTNGKHPSHKHLVILMHALNVDPNTIYSGIVDSGTLSNTDKCLNELIRNIRASIIRSDLYKDSLKYQDKFEPKSLGKISADITPQREVAERDFDFNRKDFSF